MNGRSLRQRDILVLRRLWVSKVGLTSAIFCLDFVLELYAIVSIDSIREFNKILKGIIVKFTQ